MTEYVYGVHMCYHCTSPSVYWSDSLFNITTFTKCRIAEGWDARLSDIERINKMYTMMFPTHEVKIFSDLNGNQYVLTKEMYVDACNRATIALDGTKYDIMEKFLWYIHKFVTDRDFVALIESVGAMVIEERYDQNIDKFTFGALEHHIQKYRIR